VSWLQIVTVAFVGFIVVAAITSVYKTVLISLNEWLAHRKVKRTFTVEQIKEQMAKYQSAKLGYFEYFEGRGWIAFLATDNYPDFVELTRPYAERIAKLWVSRQTSAVAQGEAPITFTVNDAFKGLTKLVLNDMLPKGFQG
jgi:hypothetical protein